MNPKPIRLIRPKERETSETELQQKARREIQAEHVANKWTPIQIRDDRNALLTDDILSNSFRKTDIELG